MIWAFEEGFIFYFTKTAMQYVFVFPDSEDGKVLGDTIIMYCGECWAWFFGQKEASLIPILTLCKKDDNNDYGYWKIAGSNLYLTGKLEHKLGEVEPVFISALDYLEVFKKVLMES